MKLKSLGHGISKSDKGIYYLNFKDIEGVSRRRKCNAKSLPEAKRLLQDIKNEISDLKSGRIMPIETDVVDMPSSLDELAVKYFELTNRNKDEVLARQNVRRYENWIKPSMGGKKLPISSIEVLEFQNRLIDSYVVKGDSRTLMATATVNLVMSLFKTVVNWGVRHKLVSGDMVDVRKLEVSNNRERVLSSDDVSLLFDRLREDVAKAKPSRAGGMSRGSSTKEIALRNLVVCGLGLYTGARPASYIGLRKSDIRVDEDGYPTYIYYAERKGGKPIVAPVHEGLRAMLGGYLESLRGDRLFEVSYNSIKRSLSGILDELFNEGLDSHDTANRVSLYTLRHTFATRMLEATGDIYAVSSVLGHRQIETTKRYAKQSNESLDKAVQSVRF